MKRTELATTLTVASGFMGAAFRPSISNTRSISCPQLSCTSCTRRAQLLRQDEGV